MFCFFSGRTIRHYLLPLDKAMTGKGAQRSFHSNFKGKGKGKQNTEQAFVTEVPEAPEEDRSAELDDDDIPDSTEG